jgi:hypothetical protein
VLQKEFLLSSIPYPVYMENQKKAIRKFRIQKKFTKDIKTPQSANGMPEAYCGGSVMYGMLHRGLVL